MCLDRQTYANSVDQDQTPRSAASDLGRHCLPLIQQYLHTLTGNKMDLKQSTEVQSNSVNI